MPPAEAIRGLIGQHIERYGQHLVCVRRSQGDVEGFVPFVYSIGNHERGLPELLLIGEDEDMIARALNALGEVQRERGTPFRHGELVDFTAKFPALIIDAGARGREEFAVQVSVYYRTEDFEVRQVIVCDPAGRFPDHPDCAEPWRSQQLLRPRHPS